MAVGFFNTPQPRLTVGNRVQNAYILWPVTAEVLATRNPLLLFLFVRLFLLRLAERQLLSLLFHEPPRNTALRPYPAQMSDFSKKFFAFGEMKEKKEALNAPQGQRVKG